MPAANERKSTLRVLPATGHPPAENDDRLRRAQEGEVSAIREYYLSYHEAIYRFIWSRVHDPDLAEDLTGEVFIRMIKNLPGYQDRSLPFRAWLYRIARNLVIDTQRKEGSRITLPLKDLESQPGDGETPEERTVRILAFDKVRHALKQLAADEREVVELRFLAGLSLKETALVVDKTVAAVKALQHHGLASLKARMPQ